MVRYTVCLVGGAQSSQGKAIEAVHRSYVGVIDAAEGTN